MLIFLLLLFSVLPSHALERKVERITDFSCGLVLGQGYDQGGKIGRINFGCSRDAQNVYFTKKNGAVIAREQYAGANSTATSASRTAISMSASSQGTVQWLEDFADNAGTAYTLLRSSQNITYCDSSTPPICTFLPGVVLKTTAPIQGIVALNGAWIIGGGTAPFFVGRDFAVAWFPPNAPQGTLIASFRNRILIAGVPGRESILYISGQDNGLDWTTGNRSTSPFTMNVGGLANPELVTCLMGVQNDAFRIGTTKKLYSLLGFSQDDFRIAETANVGVYNARGAVVFPDGEMIWSGNDGFYSLSGNELKKISLNIDTLARRIAVQGSFASRGERPRNFTAGNHNGDYWFSYIIAASLSYTENDSILVYERPRGAWTQFTNIAAASFANLSAPCFSHDKFHFGNADGNGKFFSFGRKGVNAGNASNCNGPVEGTVQASFELWPMDAQDPSTMKAFETAYVVTHSTPSEFYAPYSPMATRVFYTMDSNFFDSSSEVTLGTINSQVASRLQAPRINFSQSGVGSIPKGRWISLGFSSVLQYNPLLIEEIILYYSVIGRI